MKRSLEHGAIKMTFPDPDSLHKLELAYRMKMAQLNNLEYQRKEIEKREGQIRVELQRLENEKFKLLRVA